MIRQLNSLEIRQQELKNQSNREKRKLREHFDRLEKPIAWGNKGLEALHFVKDNPLLCTSVLAALAYYKPKLASKALTVVGAVNLLKGIFKNNLN